MPCTRQWIVDKQREPSPSPKRTVRGWLPSGGKWKESNKDHEEDGGWGRPHAQSVGQCLDVYTWQPLADYIIPVVPTGLNKSLQGPSVDRLSHPYNHLAWQLQIQIPGPHPKPADHRISGVRLKILYLNKVPWSASCTLYRRGSWGQTWEIDLPKVTLQGGGRASWPPSQPRSVGILGLRRTDLCKNRGMDVMVT